MRVVVSDIFSSQPFEDFSLNSCPRNPRALARGSKRTNYPYISRHRPDFVAEKRRRV